MTSVWVVNAWTVEIFKNGLVIRGLDFDELPDTLGRK